MNSKTNPMPPDDLQHEIDLCRLILNDPRFVGTRSGRLVWRWRRGSRQSVDVGLLRMVIAGWDLAAGKRWSCSSERAEAIPFAAVVQAAKQEGFRTIPHAFWPEDEEVTLIGLPE